MKLQRLIATHKRLWASLMLIWMAASAVVMPGAAWLLEVNAQEMTPTDVVAVTPAPVSGSGRQLRINMKDMGDEQGFTLKTVKTERQYHFTKPQGWKVLPSSVVHVSFQHSPTLLEKRSALNVLLNNRILKTIPLDKSNVTPTQLDIAIPPALLKDHNVLAFQVDQHYTLDCEDPFSAELWTTILPDTTMRLDYQPLPVKPDLAAFPYPLLDELNTYAPSKIGFTLPDSLSDASLEALGIVMVHIGQRNSWREYEPFLVSSSNSGSGDSLVLVGTPSENPAIESLGGSGDVHVSGGKFVDASGVALPDTYGVIQLIPNPNTPSKAVLVVSGNGPEGVKMAAKTLAQNPSNRLLVGRSAIIKEFQPGPEHPFRAWDGFIQHSGDTFHNLGMETQSARGITALPILYKVKKMPDLFLPGQRKVKIHTIYSYASQIMNEQSKLEVKLNGKPIKSVPLNNPKGETLAEMTFEVPTEEFFTYNDLEYQFHLFPEKYDACRFVTDVHIWGTIHNTSWVELPGEVKTPVPDVGLVNDGGFPFTAYQDLSHVAVVMPKQATDGDKEVMIQTLSRLGRESASRRGISIRAFHADSLPGDVRGDSHLIVIGNKDRNPLLNELRSKSRLVVEEKWTELRTPDGKVIEMGYSPDQGLVEQMLSPWNDKRVVLILNGETDTALNRIAQLFAYDKWFSAIEQGNLVVVNSEGPKSLTVLTKGEARFLLPQDLQGGFVMPTWGWILVGFLAVLGLFSILRFLFGR